MASDIRIVGAGGEYMESVTVVDWAVSLGDQVRQGDVVVVVETAKAATEVEAPSSGVLNEIVAHVGDEVAIGAVLGRITNDGEASDHASADTPEAVLQPVAEVAPAETAEAPVQRPRSNGRIFASPLARRIAKSLNIDLARVDGTGPNGRIKRRDVERVHAQGQAHTATIASAPTEDRVRGLFDYDGYEWLPHDAMRLAIARRLSRSKQTVPHFYLSVDCVIDDLLAMRGEINSRSPTTADTSPPYSISISDLVVMAHAKALIAVPEANVSWADTGMLSHSHADIAVAVALPGGLITPIIRQAEKKSLSEISGEMKGLVQRAHDRLLAPREYQGGTSTVSNLGMFGIDEFAAIINPPQATILTIGAARPAPVVRNGEVVAATVMTAGLSVDHRAVDGAVAARLLGAFKSFIENPVTMLV